ncbi:MAG: hypothetical protein OEU95_07200, partial [Nitrospirota bacterium]|nr:hypothetical protein [Nitrospirota bacterium]
PVTYAKVHGVPESFFEKVVNSVTDAVKVKRENDLQVTIGVQFLVIKENMGDIEDSIKIFSGIGVDYFSLKPYSLNPNMLQKRDEHYTAETARSIQEIVDRHKNNCRTELIFRKNAMNKYMVGENTFSHCYALPFYGYLSSGGEFITCKEFIGDERFSAGNIYEKDMAAIFYGKDRRESIEYGREIMEVKNKCRLNCRMARINEFLEVIENEPEHVNFI